jgi:hypothetical protein
MLELRLPDRLSCHQRARRPDVMTATKIILGVTGGIAAYKAP